MTEYNLKNPFLSKLTSRIKLSKEGSDKRTYHLVLDIKDSNITYTPGDSAVILPINAPELVSKTIKSLNANPEDPITTRLGQTISLQEFLITKASITKISSALIRLFLKHPKDKEQKKFLQHLLHKNHIKELKEYLDNHELWDLLEELKPDITYQKICEKLLPLTPRFYSIASCQQMHKDEIHLIVVNVNYVTSNIQRNGVTTTFLLDLAEINKTPIPLYVHRCSHFRLPEDPNTPIIMIGPGTGIAPFKGFLEARMLTNSDKNWLFFGERYKKQDFYYEDFLLDLEKKKMLKLDLAFSRDQEKKSMYKTNS